MKRSTWIAESLLALLGIANNPCDVRADDLREGLLKAFDSVSAWSMEYESVVPSDARGAPVDHQFVALREPSCIYYWSSKFRRGIEGSWHDDLQQQRIIISRNREYSDYPRRRFFRVKDVDDQSLFPATLTQDFLWAVIAWWPIAPETNHLFADEPYLVHDLLKSDNYRFRVESEDVGGIECRVLESPGRAALWFDAKRVGALLARESYSAHTGEPQWRIELAKHKEIKPGIWWPMEFRHIQYDSKASTEAGRKRRVIDATFRVRDVRINEDVADNLFDFPTPKPGTIQAFEDGTSKQIVPGGYDYWDEIEDWVQRNVRPDKPVSRVSGIEVVCHAVAILTSAYVILSRWRSYRGTPRTPTV